MFDKYNLNLIFDRTNICSVRIKIINDPYRKSFSILILPILAFTQVRANALKEIPPTTLPHAGLLLIVLIPIPSELMSDGNHKSNVIAENIWDTSRSRRLRKSV
jgi:hypothetical protein